MQQRNSTQLVAKYIGEDGVVRIDDETWFYNIVDHYNGDNVNRYGDPMKILDNVQLTFEEWKKLTSRKEFVDMSFDEFLKALDLRESLSRVKTSHRSVFTYLDNEVAAINAYMGNSTPRRVQPT